MNRKKYIILIAGILITVLCATVYTYLYKTERLTFQDNDTYQSESTDIKSNSELEILSFSEIVGADKTEVDTSVIDTSEQVDNKEALNVYVIGAVHSPDVYTLFEGDIVKDAIIAAGGATDEADLEALNLAAKVYDGQKLRVPKTGEDPLEYPPTDDDPFSNKNTDNALSNDNGLININTADQNLLMTLDGIGESISRGIIQYREEKGLFKKIEDIKNVSRIGEKTFDKIKDYIRVD